VHGHSILAKVVIPAVLAPILAAGVAMLATRLSYWIAKPDERPRSHRYYRYGQLASASLVSAVMVMPEARASSCRSSSVPSKTQRPFRTDAI